MLKVSFNHPFKLISILPGPGYRLVLGDVVLMDDDEAYGILEENLGENWDELCGKSVDKQSYRVGDHVLAKSESLGGFKRGIIQDQVECVPGTSQYVYNVFFYDHGIIEDVEGASAIPLSFVEEWKKNLLPPRTVIVRPVRISKAPLKGNCAGGPAVALFLESLTMSKKSKQLATSWLTEGVHSLRIQLALDNYDLTALGDVVRQTCSDEPSSSKNQLKMKEESFSDWLIEMNFAKFKTSEGNEGAIDEIMARLKNATILESICEFVCGELEKDEAESSDEETDELFVDRDPTMDPDRVYERQRA